MQSASRYLLAPAAMVITCFFILAWPLPGRATEDGYRLLEFDGYKVKWGDPRLGMRASISYAFAHESEHFDEAQNCGDLVSIDTMLGEQLSMAAVVQEAAAAFRVWERAAGLSFHQVDSTRDADIVIGVQGQPVGRAFTNVAYATDPKNDVREIEQALICFNPEHAWKVGFGGSEEVYDIRYTLIHEIGHAIGLDHPGASGQVMAFRYTEDFNDLQPGDLRGIRLLYGHPEINDI